MIVGLRDFDFREFLKTNLDFITGIFSEIGLIILVILAFFVICSLPLFFRI